MDTFLKEASSKSENCGMPNRSKVTSFRASERERERAEKNAKNQECKKKTLLLY